MGQNLKTILKEDASCAFFVLNAHGQRGFSPGTGEEGVGEVDVDLGLKERAEDIFEIRGAAGEFDNDEIGFTKGDGVFLKNGSSTVRIINNHASNGAIRGV